MSRKHSSNITLDAAKAQQAGKKSKNSLAASLFPAKASMVENYPYLKKHSYLLPVAWISRIIKYAGEHSVKKGNSAAASLKIGNERVKLMEQYHILKPDRK
jgi:hypothetical protein